MNVRGAVGSASEPTALTHEKVLSNLFMGYTMLAH